MDDIIKIRITDGISSLYKSIKLGLKYSYVKATHKWRGETKYPKKEETKRKLTISIFPINGSKIGYKMPTAAKLWAVKIPTMKERHAIIIMGGKNEACFDIIYAIFAWLTTFFRSIMPNTATAKFIDIPFFKKLVFHFAKCIANIIPIGKEIKNEM